MGLREDVVIRTPTGELQGHLFVGPDHLPELLVDCGCPEYYRAATFPHVWELRPTAPMADVLLRSWWDIVGVRARIAQVEREAEETTNADAAERMKTWNSHTNKR